MRGMQKAVVLLAVMLGGISTMNAAQAGAVEKGDIEIAIKKAELAVMMVKSPEFDSEKAYLKDRVALAKKAVLNLDGYSNENLNELVATLEEGARALRLTAGVDRLDASEDVASVAAKAKMTDVATEGQATAIVQQNKVKTEPKVAVASVQGAGKVEAAKVVSAQNTNVAAAQQGAVLANAEKTGPKEDVAEKESQGKDTEQKTDQEVEVPRTGSEEKNEPSLVAVAITVGVIVGLSAFGAVAIVKRMKKNA